MDLSSSKDKLHKSFVGKSIYERFINLMVVLKTIRKSTAEITNSNIDVLKEIVRIEGLSQDSEVNQYLDKLVEENVLSVFNVVIEKKQVVDEKTGEKKPKQYDEYIMSLSKVHPDEYSYEDFQDDMKDHFEDE